MERTRRAWTDRLDDKIDRTTSPDGCHLWTGGMNTPSRKRQSQPGASRRPIFRLNTNGRGPGQVVVYATRLVLAHATGLPYDHPMEAAHKCDNPLCMRVDLDEQGTALPTHLYWATPDENREDRYGE